MVQELTIEDLAKRSGLSLRTLRYYIQEDLLPGPDTLGKYASYSQHHLNQIALIQRLKRLHLPLQEIRLLLLNMTPEDMNKVRRYQDLLNPDLEEKKITAQQSTINMKSSSSALSYIRNLERSQNNLRSLANIPSVPAKPQSKAEPEKNNQSLREQRPNYLTEQETWTKIILSEGIELNIRNKEEKIIKGKIDELINFATQLFESKPIGGKKHENK